MKDWPAREGFVPVKHNVQNLLLVNHEKVLLSPLHIKLGLVINFVKALDRSGKGFMYFHSKFPNLSDAKVKEGISVSPQVRKLMFDENFKRKLNSTELAASFRALVCGFLCNKKKRGKLARNHTKSATELPEIRMLDIIENALLTLTLQLLS